MSVWGQARMCVRACMCLCLPMCSSEDNVQRLVLSSLCGFWVSGSGCWVWRRRQATLPAKPSSIRYRLCFWGMAETPNQGGVCLWDYLVDMEDAFKFWTFSALCLALPRTQEKWVSSHLSIPVPLGTDHTLLIKWRLLLYFCLLKMQNKKRLQFWILPSGDAQEIWVSAVLCASAVTSMCAILDDLGLSRTY